VSEIFTSIEGEGIRAGYLTNFIRLANCNLDCAYCDTVYAKNDDTAVEMTVSQIINKFDKDVKKVTITGGEPFFREKDEIVELIDALKDYEISVETNGTGIFRKIHSRYQDISFIVDYKLPDSLMEHHMILDNYFILREHDAVKFVVSSYKDLTRMVEIADIITCKVKNPPMFFVSGAKCEKTDSSKIKLTEIADFIKNNKLNKIRMQLQLHKYIWNPQIKGK